MGAVKSDFRTVNKCASHRQRLTQLSRYREFVEFILPVMSLKTKLGQQFLVAQRFGAVACNADVQASIPTASMFF